MVRREHVRAVPQRPPFRGQPPGGALLPAPAEDRAARPVSATLLTGCLCFLTTSWAGAEPQLIPDNALGAHAMLYFDTPEAGDDAVFAEAEEERASTIRLDIFMPQLLAANNAIDWTWITV